MKPDFIESSQSAEVAYEYRLVIEGPDDKRLVQWTGQDTEEGSYAREVWQFTYDMAPERIKSGVRLERRVIEPPPWEDITPAQG